MKDFTMKKAAALLLAAVMIFASCSDGLTELDEDRGRTTSSTGENTAGKAVFQVVLAESAARTIFPVGGDMTELTEITLSGRASTSNDDYAVIKTWADYAAFKQDDGRVVDSDGDKITAAYDYKLTADNAGSSMSATVTGVQASTSGTTTLSFALKVEGSAEDATGVGVVRISLTSGTEFTKIGAVWSAVGSGSEDNAAEETLTLSSGTDEDGEACVSAVFEKKSAAAGSYILTLKFYADYNADSTDTLVLTYPVSVIVQDGLLTSASLSDADILGSMRLLTVCHVTYDYNNGSNDSVKKDYFPASTFPDAEALSVTAPAGKKFRGWNTKADATGTRYSKGDNPSLTEDLTLYAQWCTYDDTDGYTISDEAELRAFFSYNWDGESSADVGQSDDVKLLKDISSLADWEPPFYKGVFDGNSCTISGITMKATNYAYAGFIGRSWGTIKNLTVKSGTITTAASGGTAGGIVGAAYAPLTDCVAEKMTVTAPTAGGIAGIINISSAGSAYYCTGLKVTVTGGTYSVTGYGTSCSAGGVAGKLLSGTISSPSVTGFTVVATSSGAKVGGIVGCMDGGTVSGAVFNSMTVTASAAGSASGGVAGEVGESGTVSGGTVDTYTTVTNSSYSSYSSVYPCAGGIVGRSAGTISGATNNGTVSGRYYTGGIVGYNSGTFGSTASNMTGSVSGSGSYSYTGGVAGYNAGTVSSCTVTAAAEIYGEGSYTGGVIGCNSADGAVKGTVTMAGMVTGSGSYTGGAVGYNEGTAVYGITVSGMVTGSGSYTGGIAGYNKGTVGYSTASAYAVTLSSDAKAGGTGRYTGGIVGDNEGTVQYATVNGGVYCLYSYAGGMAGGVVGYNTGTITSPTVSGATVADVYTYEGTTLGKKARYLAGVAAYNGGTITAPEVMNTVVTDNLDSSGGAVAYQVAGVATQNSGTVTGAAVSGCTIVGNTTYAYVNVNSIGIAGSAAYASGGEGTNTLTGTSNVAINKYSSISNSITKVVYGYFGSFTIIEGRSAKAKVKVTFCTSAGADGGNGTAFLCKGTPITAETTNSSTDAFDSTDLLQANKTDGGGTYTKSSLSLAAATTYTAMVSNENVTLTHYATYYVELE